MGGEGFKVKLSVRLSWPVTHSHDIMILYVVNYISRLMISLGLVVPSKMYVMLGTEQLTRICTTPVLEGY